MVTPEVGAVKVIIPAVVSQVPAVVVDVAIVVVQVAAISDDVSKSSPVFTDFARAGAPAAYAHFVRHGLGHDPAQRYPSVTAMRERLELVRDGKAPIECPITFTQRVLDGASRGANRHPIALIAAYSIGVVAAFGGVVALLLQHAR